MVHEGRKGGGEEGGETDQPTTHSLLVTITIKSLIYMLNLVIQARGVHYTADSEKQENKLPGQYLNP